MRIETHGLGRRRSLWKAPALIAAVVVSALLLASRVVEDWNWRPGAFIVVGALVFTLGFLYECVTRTRDTFAYRAAVGIALVAGFVLLWSNFVQMADVNPFAAMYLGVPMVGLLGAAVARLRPTGMSRALFVTALAQSLVLAVVILLLNSRNPRIATWTPPEWRGFAGNAVLALLFGSSAWLFRKAAREESAPSPE